MLVHKEQVIKDLEEAEALISKYFGCVTTLRL